jgi:hypothetical protein
LVSALNTGAELNQTLKWLLNVTSSAVDDTQSKSAVNHRRGLSLFHQWKPPDQSSDTV